MSLRDVLYGNHAPRVDALRHAYAREQDGELTRAQLRALNEAVAESRDAINAYHADNPDPGASDHQINPAADTRMLAEVNGVVTDLASPEYAAWYRQHYG